MTKGGWSAKVPLNGGQDFVESPAGLNLGTGYVRANLFTTTTNSTGSTTSLFAFQTPGPTGGVNPSTAIASVRLVTQGLAGPIALRLWNEVTGLPVGSDYAITASAWHTVEMECVIGGAGSGFLELKVNGVVAASGTVNTGTTNLDHLRLGNLGITGTPSGTAWLDDVIIRGDQFAGAGFIIARQGVSGTPTYDGWTKVGASTTQAYIDWSHTITNLGDYCVNTTLAAQTMKLASFGATYITPDGVKYGTGILGSSDTINVGKTVLLAQSPSTGSLLIRRYVGGTNTDTPVTVNLSYKIFDDGPWTPTYANLVTNAGSTGTTEIGAVQNNSGTQQLVFDGWIMIDYTPVGGTSITPSALNFGKVRLGKSSQKKSFEIRNDDRTLTTSASIEMTGPQVGFLVNAEHCNEIRPRGTCRVTVSFKPSAKGSASGQIMVHNNATGDKQMVGLKAVGE